MIENPNSASSAAQKLFKNAIDKQSVGEVIEAEKLYREALALAPDLSIAHFNLGVISLGNEDFVGASNSFKVAWDLDNRQYEYAANLVYALQKSGSNQPLTSLLKEFASAANRVQLSGDFANAQRLAELVTSLDTKGEFPEAHWVRANSLMMQDKGLEALQIFKTLSQTWPQYGLSCLVNVTNLQLRLFGDTDQGVLGARRLLASGKPGDSFEPFALKTLMRSLPFHAATTMYDLNEVSERARKLARNKASTDAPPPVTLPPIANPDGKLRVAFLIDRSVGSGANRAISELISNLPEERVDPGLHFIDAAPSAGGFAGLSDKEAAERLRDSKYDVVIDATDPLVGDPPGLLNYRIAPVQLAYPHRICPLASHQIDAAFATAEMISVDEADQAQTWLTLPSFFIGSNPLASAPPLTACPSITNGYVTFAVIGPSAAMGYSALDAYASVIAGVPKARLTILNELGDSPEYRSRIIERMARNGVIEKSITFGSPTAHGDMLAALKNIDIVLDSFPTPGLLTADIAWQGVFSVGFGGGAHPTARRALATYKALQMNDMVAPTRDDFISIAIELAQDEQRRKDFRASAREVYKSLPLFDGAFFAREFATVLRNACRSLSR
jgi:hypothetical protein